MITISHQMKRWDFGLKFKRVYGGSMSQVGWSSQDEVNVQVLPQSFLKKMLVDVPNKIYPWTSVSGASLLMELMDIEWRPRQKSSQQISHKSVIEPRILLASCSLSTLEEKRHVLPAPSLSLSLSLSPSLSLPPSHLQWGEACPCVEQCVVHQRHSHQPGYGDGHREAAVRPAAVRHWQHIPLFLRRWRVPAAHHVHSLRLVLTECMGPRRKTHIFVDFFCYLFSFLFFSFCLTPFLPLPLVAWVCQATGCGDPTCCGPSQSGLSADGWCTPSLPYDTLIVGETSR